MKTFQRILFWLGLALAALGVPIGLAAFNAPGGGGAAAVSVSGVALILASMRKWEQAAQIHASKPFWSTMLGLVIAELALGHV